MRKKAVKKSGVKKAIRKVKHKNGKVTTYHDFETTGLDSKPGFISGTLEYRNGKPVVDYVRPPYQPLPSLLCQVLSTARAQGLVGSIDIDWLKKWFKTYEHCFHSISSAAEVLRHDWQIHQNQLRKEKNRRFAEAYGAVKEVTNFKAPKSLIDYIKEKFPEANLRTLDDETLVVFGSDETAYKAINDIEHFLNTETRPTSVVIDEEGYLNGHRQQLYHDMYGSQLKLADASLGYDIYIKLDPRPDMQSRYFISKEQAKILAKKLLAFAEKGRLV